MVYILFDGKQHPSYANTGTGHLLATRHLDGGLTFTPEAMAVRLAAVYGSGGQGQLK